MGFELVDSFGETINFGNLQELRQQALQHGKQNQNMVYMIFNHNRRVPTLLESWVFSPSVQDMEPFYD